MAQADAMSDDLDGRGSVGQHRTRMFQPPTREVLMGCDAELRANQLFGPTHTEGQALHPLRTIQDFIQRPAIQPSHQFQHPFIGAARDFRCEHASTTQRCHILREPGAKRRILPCPVSEGNRCRLHRITKPHHRLATMDCSEKPARSHGKPLHLSTMHHTVQSFGVEIHAARPARPEAHGQQPCAVSKPLPTHPSRCEEGITHSDHGLSAISLNTPLALDHKKDTRWHHDLIGPHACDGHHPVIHPQPFESKLGP